MALVIASVREMTRPVTRSSLQMPQCSARSLSAMTVFSMSSGREGRDQWNASAMTASPGTEGPGGAGSAFFVAVPTSVLT